MRKIGYKFSIVIIILALFAIASITYLGAKIKTVSKQSAILIERDVTATNTIHEINECYLQIYRLMYCHIDSKVVTTMEGYEEEIKANEENLTVLLEQYKSTITDASIIETYDCLHKKMTGFTNSVNKIIDASHNGDKEKAKMYVNSELGNFSSNIASNFDTLLEYSSKDLANGEAILNTAQTDASRAAIIVTIAIIIISVCILLISIKMIVSPINNTTKALDEIIQEIQASEGDLSKRVPITTKDEISKLANGVNQFIDILENIILGIQKASADVDHEQTNVLQHIEKANEGASDTSSIMEELAAGMQEVSATITTETESTREVELSAKTISERVMDGTKLTAEIKQRASKLQMESQESTSHAEKMLSEMDASLAKSIEESKQIENIQTLTNDILSIASQTNLLALNASIEAARAGEAGKGFAVVADEIRTLADNSRQTANNIQEISDTVVAAVLSLTENARQLIEYMNSQVMSDYEKLNATGAQYLTDSMNVDSLLKEIEASASKLHKVTANLAEANDAISTTMHESAIGVTNVVENTTDLANDMGNISDAFQNVIDCMSVLKEQISMFKA